MTLALVTLAALAGIAFERWRVLKLLRLLRALALKEITNEEKNRPFAYALATQIERSIRRFQHWGRL